jgi:hypothetical protein
LGLLLGQGFFYGFGLALWYVAANTIFLVEWGAARLPWVFIGVGAFVSAFSYGITALQRRWTTARVVLTIGLALAAFNFLARLGLLTPLARSVSLVLMISYFLGLQMAFITLGLLAGRLFDIRQMKRFFPTVLSGFHVGFILGGLVVPLVIRRAPVRAWASWPCSIRSRGRRRSRRCRGPASFASTRMPSRRSWPIARRSPAA